MSARLFEPSALDIHLPEIEIRFSGISLITKIILDWIIKKVYNILSLTFYPRFYNCFNYAKFLSSLLSNIWLPIELIALSSLRAITS